MPQQCQALKSTALKEHWHGNVWVSPKGAVRDCRLWLNKTINEYRNGYINSFVFFAVHRNYFGLHLLSGITLSVFLSNVLSSFELLPMVLNQSLLLLGTYLLYGPPLDQTLNDIDKVTLFYNKFRDVGRVIYNEYAGDNWSKDLELILKRLKVSCDE